MASRAVRPLGRALMVCALGAIAVWGAGSATSQPAPARPTQTPKAAPSTAAAPRSAAAPVPSVPPKEACALPSGATAIFDREHCAVKMMAADPLCRNHVCPCEKRALVDDRVPRIEIDASSSMRALGENVGLRRKHELSSFASMLCNPPTASSVGLGIAVGSNVSQLCEAVRNNDIQTLRDTMSKRDQRTDLVSVIKDSGGAAGAPPKIIISDLLHDPAEEAPHDCDARWSELKTAVQEALKKDPAARLLFILLEADHDDCKDEVKFETRKGICGAADKNRCDVLPLNETTLQKEYKGAGGTITSAQLKADQKALGKLPFDKTLLPLVADPCKLVNGKPQSPHLCAMRSRANDFLNDRGTTWKVIKTSLDSNFEDVVLVGGRAGWMCTGVAVGPRTVLTAKHCTAPTEIALTSRETDAPKRFEVSATEVHPTLDVALLHVKPKLGVRSRLRRGPKDTEAPMGVLQAVGFGARNARGQVHSFERSMVGVQASGWGCDGVRATTSGCTPGDEMVLVGGPGADTCRGDSGGPVFEIVPGPKCGYRLVGIVSRSVRDAVATCGSGGIYVRADRISEWIDAGIARWEQKQ